MSKRRNNRAKTGFYLLKELSLQGPTADTTNGTSAGKTVVAVDEDWLYNRSGQGGLGHSRRAQFDVLGFAALLRAEGVHGGVVCRNRDLPAFGQQVWATLGFRIRIVHANVDPVLASELDRCAADPTVGRVILVGGDHIYGPCLRRLRRKGVITQLWARRAATSNNLLRDASSCTWIDHLFLEPVQSQGRSVQNFNNHARANSCSHANTRANEPHRAAA